MMKQYRIIRKNSYFGWRYVVQIELWNFLWLPYAFQGFNGFDLEGAQNFIVELKRNDKNFAERKKVGNSVV